MLIRDPETVIHGGAFPYMGLSPDVEGSARLMAILKVLRCLPDDAYKRLCNLFTDKYSWYIPHYEQLAEVRPFVATDERGEPLDAENGELIWAPSANVLYLSPLLEQRASSTVEAVVAHELAHVALEHCLYNDPEVYDRQEKEAWALAKTWGFVEQVNRYTTWRARARQRAESLVSDLAGSGGRRE